MQPFPHPSDAIHKIWSRLANLVQRHSCSKVWNSRYSTASNSKMSGLIRPKFNSTKLLCLSWLPATLMMIPLKMNKLAWRHRPFSVVSDPIWPKFELVWDFTHVLITCKYNKDRTKSNREKVESHFPHYKSMGDFCCFDLIYLKTLCSLSPPPVMLHIKFDQDWQMASVIFKFESVKFSSFKGKYLQSEFSDPAQNQTLPSFYACPAYQQLWWWFNHKWTS